jgi:transcriptional regulator with XRE-family HTH domain
VDAVVEPRSPARLAYGNALRELRSRAGLSQEGLALKARLDRTYVSGIERGERNPSMANLLKLAEALDVSLSEWARMAEAQLR